MAVITIPIYNSLQYLFDCNLNDLKDIIKNNTIAFKILQIRDGRFKVQPRFCSLKTS